MPKVLSIDTACDELSRASAAYREANVIPYLAQRGLSVVSLRASQATYETVQQVLIAGDVQFITASGHGTSDAFHGYDGQSIFETGNPYPGSVNGAIVHLLSCGSALYLGADFIQQGATAFVGYDADFSYVPSFASIYFECDGEVDCALAEGCTVGEAVQRAVARFQQRIAQASDSKVASALQFDLIHLTSPLSTPHQRWGNPGAQL